MEWYICDMSNDRNWILVSDTFNVLPEDIVDMIQGYYEVFTHENPEEIYWEDGTYIKTFRDYKGRYFEGFTTILYIVYVKYNQYHLAKWEKEDSEYTKTCDKRLDECVGCDDTTNTFLSGYLRN